MSNLVDEQLIEVSDFDDWKLMRILRWNKETQLNQIDRVMLK